MTALNDAVANLSAKILASAATASAEELAYLSKALESIGGRVALIDVQLLADDRKADLFAATETKKGELGDLVTSLRAAITAQVNSAKSDIALVGTATNKSVTDNANTTINTVNASRDAATNAGNAAVAAVGTAKQAALDTIAAAQNAVTTLQTTVAALKATSDARSADLPARKTIVAAGTVVLTASDLGLVIDIDAAKALDFTTLNITLPDATAVPAAFLHRELVIKNRSLARLVFLNNAGTSLATVQPYGWGRLTLSKMDTTAGLWRLTPLSLPAVRDRLTNQGSGAINSVGEFGAPYGLALHSGQPTYGDFAVAIPCYDDAGVKLAGSAMVTRARDTNWGYTGTWVGALADSASPAAFACGSSSGTYMWTAAGAFVSTALPVRGGVVVLGANNVNNVFNIGYYRAANGFATRIVVDDSLTLANTYYYGIAHTFGDGQYLVVAFSNSSGQFTLLKRYRFKSDGTVEAAGSITLGTSGAIVAQINDSMMAVHNGTSFGVYDMTAAGTTLAPVATPASPFPAGMANKFAMPVGRDCLIASDGAYRWDGSTLSKVAGGAGYTYAGAISGYLGVVFRDGFSSVVNPIGQDQAVNYFSDAGAFGSRSAARMVGPGQTYGYMDARIWPHGPDAVMTSHSWVYTTQNSYSAGMNAGTTELTRVAPGNMGVSGLGGK